MSAMLLALCSVLAATSPPDPTVSIVPPFVYVVGFVGSGPPHPDTDGADGPSGVSNSIVIRDFSGNPISGLPIHIQFPCDINLCTAVVGGQTVDCSSGTLNGVTDNAGRFTFTAIGAAKDPGNLVPCGPPGCVYPGGGLNSTLVKVDGYFGTFKTTTAVALDQNVTTGLPGSNGTTLADVSAVFNLAGAVALGGGDPSLYRGRGDLNADQAITIGDAAEGFAQFGRIALLGGSGCTATYCVKPACP